MDKELANRLKRGSLALAIDLTENQQAAMMEYVYLLLKWNRAYNLTAVRDPAQMISRHLLDSLAIAKHCTGERLLDVGTGAGLPGVPLAILYPDREFHLLDSNGKKTRFLFQVKTALGLDNMTVHHARVESFRPTALFDVILSRAFASLLDMVKGCRHLVGAEGYFLAMKGSFPEQELLAIENLCQVQSVMGISVPDLAEQRHLVAMTLR
ncbi:MAG: 16S rRNA (guanine(527)-N(7))-methyltransferase RsmG [Halioglobus sp.]